MLENPSKNSFVMRVLTAYIAENRERSSETLNIIKTK